MRRSAGFTLLEVLVGIVLLGFIMATLAAAGRYVFKVERIQADVLIRSGELDGVERLLRSSIAQARPGAANVRSLSGTANALLFTTNLPEPGTQEQVVSDAVLVVQAGHLMLRWASHNAEMEAGGRHEVSLLDGVASLQLAYLGTEWVDRWDGSEPPALVRIRIGFRPGDPRHWPDLVVAPVSRRPH